MNDVETQAYVDHLIKRLGKSNEAIDKLVTAIETAVGRPVLCSGGKWEPVREAILATVPLLGPAMSEARFAMTDPEQ